MKHKTFHRGIMLSLAVSANIALANPFGTSITISDKNNDGSDPTVASNWYSDREDNETETNPPTINGQGWDLEGMYLKGNTLTLVGGFDFKNGMTYGSSVFRGGDVF